MAERKWPGVVRLGLVGLVVVAVMGVGRPLDVQAADVQSAGAKDLVQKMIEVENAELLRKGRFQYLSKERSERTGGHLWLERVPEKYRPETTTGDGMFQSAGALESKQTNIRPTFRANVMQG